MALRLYLRLDENKGSGHLAERCQTQIDVKPVGRVFRWETDTPKRKD